MAKRSVIIGFARTPFGKQGGKLRKLKAVELGGIALKEAIRRSGLGAKDIELTIMGQVISAGCGQIPSRQAAINAGIPYSVPSESVNKVCASSLRAITLADQIIRSGDFNVIATGGMESMSNAPYASDEIRWGHKMFNFQFEDLMVKDGLWCPKYNVHMAVHGGKVSLANGITRELQDEWALISQTRAHTAIENKYLDREIIPVRLNDGSFMYADESPRFDTKLPDLARLKPLFNKDNTVTAGNAPGVTDGASAVIIMDEDEAKIKNLNIEAAIIGHAMYSEDPANIATAPGNAIVKLLKKTNLNAEDIDLFEINEAFAAVTLLSGKIVGCNMNKVNVNGGAIAYGHPLGASGGRLVMTLLCELQRRNKRYGIAAMCSGMGQGDAILIENLKFK